MGAGNADLGSTSPLTCKQEVQVGTQAPLVCFTFLSSPFLPAAETGFSEVPTQLNPPALVAQHCLCGVGAIGVVSCKQGLSFLPQPLS